MSVATRQTVAVEVDGRTRFVTAELRVFWPPTATEAEIELAIEKAVAEAHARIDRRRSGL